MTVTNFIAFMIFMAFVVPLAGMGIGEIFDFFEAKRFWKRNNAIAQAASNE